MNRIRRLLAVGAVLALAAVYTCTYVLGEPTPPEARKATAGAKSAAPVGTDVLADLSTTRFTNQPILTYRTQDGELFFALQIQPKLPVGAARRRDVDVMVLVDTSASQALGALTVSQKLTRALAAGLSRDDRIDIRTVNTKCADLTRGFKTPDRIQTALTALDDELPMGATDLKKALTESMAAFENKADRQQVVVFLGDGMSILDPIGPGDLAGLAEKMVKQEIAFFPVPVGPRLDPTTLHGLASTTGGAPVRFRNDDTAERMVQRVLESVAVPVLYPTALETSAAVLERYPAGKLPPLRADAPTLIVGKLKAAEKLTYTVTGKVAGQPLAVTAEQPVPEADLGNFFLAGMIRQWQDDKDHAAMIRADRALAFALQQNELARAEYMTQGEWALGENRFDAAVRLFEQAHKVDPHNPEIPALVDMAQQLRDGKVTKEQLRKDLKGRLGNKIHLGEALAQNDGKTGAGRWSGSGARTAHGASGHREGSSGGSQAETNRGGPESHFNGR